MLVALEQLIELDDECVYSQGRQYSDDGDSALFLWVSKASMPNPPQRLWVALFEEVRVAPPLTLA